MGSSYDHDTVLGHWENDQVESMYDKHLLRAEIELIRQRIPAGAKVLDAGCGEGEGTIVYAAVPGATVHAVDFSQTRLRKARERLGPAKNVTLKQVDFAGAYELDRDFDVIVSQRFLINITDWEIQKKILRDLMAHLRKGGRLAMLEGWQQGVDALNEFRALWGLAPIPVQWHNLFFDEEALIDFMRSEGFERVDEDGLGAYFLLTRGVRPTLDKNLDWNSAFNEVAAKPETARAMALGSRYSRLKLWVFAK